MYSFERFLLPNVNKKKKISFSTISQSNKLSWNALRNNAAFITFVLAYLAVNLGLFISRAVQFSDSNALYIMARAAGKLLYIIVYHKVRKNLN